MRAFAIALCIVVVACALLVALLATVRPEQRLHEPQLYRGLPPDAKLLELDKRALDEAYLRHLHRLWDVWLSDGARSADRITNGLRIARVSYHQAAEQIAKREQELEKK